jgi:hypothetical protein
MRRSRIYADETFRGYESSKLQYFYGLKIHLLWLPLNDSEFDAKITAAFNSCRGTTGI